MKPKEKPLCFNVRLDGEAALFLEHLAIRSGRRRSALCAELLLNDKVVWIDPVFFSRLVQKVNALDDKLGAILRVLNASGALSAEDLRGFLDVRDELGAFLSLVARGDIDALRACRASSMLDWGPVAPDLTMENPDLASGREEA